MEIVIRNKRGDVPITILVIGVLAICAAAILSFSISNQYSKNDFSGLGIVEEAVAIKEKISFYQELGFGKQEIEEFSDIAGYIKYDRIRKTDYLFLKNDQISVRYDLDFSKEE